MIEEDCLPICLHHGECICLVLACMHKETYIHRTSTKFFAADSNELVFPVLALLFRVFGRKQKDCAALEKSKEKKKKNNKETRKW